MKGIKMETKACPSMAGTITGYVPEYQTEDKVWKRIPTPPNPLYGVVRGRCYSDVLSLCGFYGYESAMAIVWIFKANSERGFCLTRVVPYEIKYNVEAFRNEEKSEEISPIKEARCL
jgi:hypothetical protein